MTQAAAALKAVRVVDVGRELLQNAVEVARVERGVEILEHAAIVSNYQVANT